MNKSIDNFGNTKFLCLVFLIIAQAKLMVTIQTSYAMVWRNFLDIKHGEEIRISLLVILGIATIQYLGCPNYWCK
jgi:uncharacterized membrane protein YcgQ (UPF0703/DUF1980 family)